MSVNNYFSNLRQNKLIKRGVPILLAAIMLVWAISAWASGSVTDMYVTPDPVKIGQSAYVRYTIDQNAFVTINIYDQNGTLVRTVINNISKAAGSYSQAWDCKAGGILVNDGMYRFVVEARDAAGGNLLGSAEVTQAVARVPGISAVSDTPDPINPDLGQQSTISYTLASNSLVTVTILKGTTPVRTIYADQLKSAGANTAVWDGKDDSGVVVGDASYYYKIDAVSPVAPTLKATFKTNTITVDKGAPGITDFIVAPNPFKISVSNMSIKYTLSKTSTVNLKVVQGNTTVKNILNAVSQNAGNITVSWDGKDEGGSYIGEGNYTVVVNATDSSNRSSGDKTATFVAGYQPAVSSVTASPATINPKDTQGATQTTVTYSLSQTAKVTAEILKGNSIVRTIFSNQTKTAGSNSFTWDGKDDFAGLLGDADYTVRVTAVSPTVDTFSNASSGTVTVETGAPGISDLSLTPDPMKIGVSNLSIRFNLTEDASVDITVSKGGTVIKNIAAAQAKLSGSTTFTWDGKNTVGDLVDEGTYTVAIKATDRFNNVKETSGTVKAGYLASISNVRAAPATFNPPVDVNTAVYFDLSNDANVTLSILKGSLPLRTINAGPVTKGTNKYIFWNGKDDTGAIVPDGSYGFRIDAVSPTIDTFTSRATGTLTVESAAPDLTDLSITPEPVKIGSTATIRYSISEPATINIQIANSQGAVRTFDPVTKSSNGSYSVSWDTKAGSGALITKGSYKLVITVTDGSNNSTTKELPFEAGSAPVISNHSADPTTLNLAAGITNTTISYTVDQDSYVSMKLVDADGIAWKTVFTDKLVTGQDSVTVNVYENGIAPPTTNISYVLNASSVLGYFKAAPVSGALQVLGIPNPPMDCKSCHGGYPLAHPMANCAGCHSNNEPIEDCAKCHTLSQGHSDGSVLTKFKCTYCHNDEFSYKVPGHGDITAIHNTNLAADCSKCHDSNLTVEHPKYNDMTMVPPQPYDCTTCHESTVAGVVYAIDNGLKDCAACHAATINTRHESYHTAPGITADCTKCHVDGLITEHLNNPKTGNIQGKLSCGTCHSSTAANVVDAIAGKKSNCDACHTSTDHEAVHTPTQIKTECVECHKDSLTQEHLNNPTTQTGNSFTCGTCHSSEDPLVVAAIKDKKLNCEACHTIAGHDQFHDTNNLDGNCLTCHNNNLSYEHLKNIKTQLDDTGAFAPKNCNTCHASTQQTVTGAVYTGNTQCAACHRTGHNISFAENVPAYVYQYPGFEWTPPQDAFLWEGESWMPSDYILGGKVILSNRRTGTTAGVVDTVYGPVFDYYNSKLMDDNWTLTSPGPAQPDYFMVTYKKGTHQQTIWFYGGVGHTASPVLDAGYRIEVIYK